MQDYVWDARTGAHLLTIREGKVYRARDGREIGTAADGNVYGLQGEFVCALDKLDSAPAGAKPGALPASLKALLD